MILRNNLDTLIYKIDVYVELNVLGFYFACSTPYSIATKFDIGGVYLVQILYNISLYILNKLYVCMCKAFLLFGYIWGHQSKMAPYITNRKGGVSANFDGGGSAMNRTSKKQI